MAIFTLINTFVLPGMGSLSLFGLSTQATAAIVAVGRSALWTLSGQALNAPKVPAQQVMATLNQTDAPRIRAYGRVLLGGQRAFYEAHSGHLHQIIVAHHGPVHDLRAIWIDGEIVPVETAAPSLDGGGKLGRYLFVGFRNGTGFGGDYADAFTGAGVDWTPIPDAFPGLWTSDHRLEGQATFYAVFGDPPDEDFAKTFPKGPNTVVQIEVRASRVANNAGSMVYSENAGACIRDFMRHPDGWAIPASRMDTASWNAFVNLCGETVTLPSGATEMRYRIGGSCSLADQLKDTAQRMLACCDGQLYETPEGKIGILGGAWSEPDVTITAADILSIDMKDGFDPFTDYNVLKGMFTSRHHAYQPIEVPAIRDAEILLQQEERVKNHVLDMCPSAAQLKRLMRVQWAKDHREHVGTVKTNLVGMKARFPKADGIHTIRIQAEEFGLDDVFEVTSHTFSVVDGFCEIGIASIENVYGPPQPGDEDVTPAITDLGIPDNRIVPPENPVVTQQIVSLSGDATAAKLVVVVDAPDRDSLQLQAQVAAGTHAATSTSAAWLSMASADLRAETGVLDDLGTYTIRVRWRGKSDWIIADVVTVVANPTAPAAPTSFSAVATAPNVSLDWINAPENFWRTRIYRNTVNNRSTATLIKTVSGVAGEVSGYVDAPGVTGTVYYWAVTVNASRIESAAAGPRSVTL